MNNRYLYKAKRKDNGEWVEGIPIKTHIGLFICFEENPHYCSQYGYMEIDEIIIVDENTLCQCIGSEDKNGKLIWENDICIIHSNPIDEEDGYFTVGWDNDDARFKLESNKLVIDFESIHSYECEVVGNIFDNPELLEGGEN